MVNGMLKKGFSGHYGVGQVFGSDRLAVGYEDRPFNDILEFTDVSGPGIITDDLQCVGGYFLLLLAELPAVFFQVISDEGGYILSAFPSGTAGSDL